MEPVPRDTLVDAIVERLRAEILAGTLVRGSLLPPERALAAQLGVTRTSLKHALVRLAQAGIVETRHGVGTRVLDFERQGGPDLLPVLAMLDGPGWLNEILEVRRELGVLVARRAAKYASREHRALLVAQVEAVHSAPNADVAQLAACEIHRIIADATGNRVYGLLLNGFLNTYLELRHLFNEPFSDPVAAAERLKPFVQAVCDGRDDDAGKAADIYFSETEQLLLSQQPGGREV